MHVMLNFSSKTIQKFDLTVLYTTFVLAPRDITALFFYHDNEDAFTMQAGVVLCSAREAAYTVTLFKPGASVSLMFSFATLRARSLRSVLEKQPS